ncbi:MAG: 50S ribosomal protein L2 [Planctomycetes bacterium]|jgi:large subunit ribosomal protein L2|nr:50S ribosomal protein L2 [Planctomycetota bacterium]
MGIKKVKPITPGRRGATFDDFSDITKKEPEKSLVMIKKRQGGRNAQGKITVRHRGGGAKRYIRQVDYKREKYDIPALVKSIEYDPNRGARIALLHYADGAKRYIIAPQDLAAGEKVMSSREKIEIKKGNAMPIKFIPPGVMVYNVELEPGRGGRLARGAGNIIQVMGVEKKYTQVKLPSGEIRLIKNECLCTIGQASNPDKRHIKLGSAGRTRHKGIRPTVRGTAMNPVDHPHGGGEGKQSIGLKHPKTPWGKPALGVKTRNQNKFSTKLIISRRGKKR